MKIIAANVEKDAFLRLDFFFKEIKSHQTFNGWCINMYIYPYKK